MRSCTVDALRGDALRASRREGMGLRRGEMNSGLRSEGHVFKSPMGSIASGKAVSMCPSTGPSVLSSSGFEKARGMVGRMLLLREAKKDPADFFRCFSGTGMSFTFFRNVNVGIVALLGLRE